LTTKNKILNIIYVLTVLLFLLDVFTSFDIKSQSIKSLVYIGLLISTPLILVWNIMFVRIKTTRAILVLFPMIMLIGIILLNPQQILSSTSAWQTQTVLYKNRHISFKAIEFQIQNRGAMGYHKRTIEVCYLTPFFMVTSEVPNKVDLRPEWVKVDRDVNEFGLK